jgi:hypothetical protein
MNLLYDCLASDKAMSANKLLTAFCSILSLELNIISSGFIGNLSLISDKLDKRCSVLVLAM